MASQYYCHRCAAELGYIHEPQAGKKIRTQYQLEKYAKHTAPDSEQAIQSVFLQSDTSAYARYIVNALLAGAVEVDEQGRHNVIWAAGTPTGFLYEHGQLVRPQDSVKVVLYSNTGLLHAFPESSTSFTPAVCSRCGCDILF